MDFNVDPYSVPFFYDFMLFLKHLEKQPIKQTATGAISLSNIKPLIEHFKEQETVNEFKKYGWHLRREEELQFLTKIKIIAEVMYLTHKRKGYLYLSKYGREFLRTDTVSQYKEMVMNYWERVNWGYFSPYGPIVERMNLAEKLQGIRMEIWRALYRQGEAWHDYKRFCFSLRDYFKLENYLRDNDPEYSLFFDINSILFRKNLLLFGCAELVEGKAGKYDWERNIEKFRLTPLGLLVLKAALENSGYGDLF